MMHTNTQIKDILRSGLGCLVVLLLIISQAGSPPFQEGSRNARANDVAAGARAIYLDIDASTTQTVLVTNSSDDVNGETSSMAALIASPGPDGISFREALMATNSTAGEKTIEFDSALAGHSIYLLPINGNWPILTAGDLTILGDIDGDGVPDITLDGSFGIPSTPTSQALSIWSDNNTISGLAFKGFSGTAILFGAPNFYAEDAMTISGNRIIGNTIENSVISVSPFGWVDFSNPAQVSNLTWRDIVITGNHLTSTLNHVGGINLIAAGRTASNNRILNATITDNTVVGYDVGIMVIAADSNTQWAGMPWPIRYADDNLIQGVTISNNVVESIKYKGIEIGAGNMGNSGNQVLDVIVSNNQIRGAGVSNYAFGITISSASDGNIADRMTADNRIAGVDVFENTIEDTSCGIFARASDTNFTEQSPGYTRNRLEDLTITDNVLLRSGGSGIRLWGGRSYINILNYDNVVSNVIIQGNEIRETSEPWYASGIHIIGGLSQGSCLACVSGNMVQGISVVDNEVEGFKFGVHGVGGEGQGAVNNQVSGVIRGNLCEANTIPVEIAENEGGALGNQIDIDWLLYLYLPFSVKNMGP
jgi:hypothetical protein